MDRWCLGHLAFSSHRLPDLRFGFSALGRITPSRCSNVAFSILCNSTACNRWSTWFFHHSDVVDLVDGAASPGREGGSVYAAPKPVTPGGESRVFAVTCALVITCSSSCSEADFRHFSLPYCGADGQGGPNALDCAWF